MKAFSAEASAPSSRRRLAIVLLFLASILANSAAALPHLNWDDGWFERFHTALAGAVSKQEPLFLPPRGIDQDSSKEPGFPDSIAGPKFSFDHPPPRSDGPSPADFSGKGVRSLVTPHSPRAPPPFPGI